MCGGCGSRIGSSCMVSSICSLFSKLRFIVSVGKQLAQNQNLKTNMCGFYVACAMSNQIVPLCEKMFTDNLCARQYCRSLGKNKRCSAQNRTGSNKFGPPSVEKLEEEVCSMCNEEIKGHDEIREHFKKHLMNHVGILSQAPTKHEQA